MGEDAMITISVPHAYDIINAGILSLEEEINKGKL
jgi:hypothetical protein